MVELQWLAVKFLLAVVRNVSKRNTAACQVSLLGSEQNPSALFPRLVCGKRAD